MVGARGQNIPWYEIVDMAHPLNATGNVVGHVIGVEVLSQSSIDSQLHFELHGVFDFISRHDVRTNGRKSGA